MRVLSCLEHQTIPIGRENFREPLSLTTKEAMALERVAPSLPTGSLTWGRNSVKFAQYCGLIQAGDLCLEILPKAYGNDADYGRSRQNLVRMLQKAGFLKLLPVGSATISLQTHTLLDVFISHFCLELRQALVQGKARQYETVEENLGVVRGKLLFAQQMKRNLAHRERLYCEFEVFSEDILLNQIIKYCLKHLLRYARQSDTRQHVQQMLMLFGDISDVPVTLASFGRLQLNRTNAAYHPILHQCRLFLSGLNPDMYAGQQDVFAFLFDMNALFEKWLAALMKPLAWRYGLMLKEQGPKRYLAYRQDLDKPVFQTRPDMALLDETRRVVWLADAKWKLLDSAELKMDISQADLYQMIAYANRYEVGHLLLIYPYQENFTAPVHLRVNGPLNASITVLPVDIQNEARAKQALADLAFSNLSNPNYQREDIL